jgi:SAM-dependent methyltransferase
MVCRSVDLAENRGMNWRRTLLRSTWNRRADSWHAQVESSPGFERIRAELLNIARPSESDRAVDLGAGSGFVALELASRVREVIAVDLSPAMLQRLSATATAAEAKNLTTIVSDLSEVDFPPASVDLVVSSYALHHLSDVEKRALVARARSWLGPSGRIVIADIMMGRGATASDRSIIREKVRTLARKGPGGLWRVAKGVVRFGLRVGNERPASPDFWTSTLRQAGFEAVEFSRIVSEAGIVCGVVPPSLDARIDPRTSDAWVMAHSPR